MADDKIVSIVGQSAINELNKLSELLEKNVNLVVQFNDVTKSGQLKIAGADSLTELNRAIKEATTGLGKLSKASTDTTKITLQEAKVRKEIAIALDREASARLKNARAAEVEARAITLTNKERERAQKIVDNTNRLADKEAEKAKKLGNAYEILKRKYTETANEAKRLQAVALGGGDKNAAQKSVADAQRLYSQLLSIETAVGQAQRQVGQYNMVGAQFNQLLRETPSFAYNASTGILGLSNNIPYFFDAVKKARQEGASFGVILKSIGKEVVSLSGLMMIAVSAITIYMARQSMAENATKKAKDANKEYKESIENIDKAARSSAAQETARLQALSAAATNTALSIDKRADAAREMQKLWPGTLKYLSEEAIMEGKVADAIKKTTDAIMARAMAEAAEKKLAQASELVFNTQEQLDAAKKSVEDYRSFLIRNVKSVGEEAKKNANISIDEILRIIDRTGADTEGAFTSEMRNRQKALGKVSKLLDEATASQKKYADAVRDATADAFNNTNEPGEGTISKLRKDLDEVNRKLELAKIGSIEQIELAKERKRLEDELNKAIGNTLNKEKKSAKDYQELLKELELTIKSIQLSFRDKTDMGDLEDIAQGIGNKQGNTSPIPSILAGVQSTERNKQLLQRESDYYDELSAIENTHFKTKLEKEQALTQAQIKYAQDRYQIERKALDEQMALLPADSEERLQLLAQANAKELELYQTLNEAKVKDDERAAATRRAIEEKLQDTVMQLWNMAAQAYAQFAQIRANNTIEQIDRDIEHNEIQATREIERIKADNTIIDKQKEIAEVEAKTASQRLALEEKQKQARQRAAIAEKAATISQLTLATALAVMRALGDKEIPYPLRVVNAIAAGVVGASQIAIAAATPLPQYAEGTQHHKGGAFIAGEAGERELVVRPDNKAYWTDKVAGIYNEPKGTRVIPESKLYSMPALGGGLAMQKKGEPYPVLSDKGIIRAIQNNKPTTVVNVYNGSKVKHWSA